ncbi:MAG: hypothetical protein HYZ49_00990 [Chloroflexi bacterium]|nr:hypothetical protein [Chloroflexota bacterium]
MQPDKPKPPTNYRALSAATNRNLLIGFFVILFLAGVGLIGLFYGGGGVLGALACLIPAVGLVGVLALVMAGLGKLSEWLDKQ